MNSTPGLPLTASGDPPLMRDGGVRAFPAAVVAPARAEAGMDASCEVTDAGVGAPMLLPVATFVEDEPPATFTTIRTTTMMTTSADAAAAYQIRARWRRAASARACAGVRRCGGRLAGGRPAGGRFLPTGALAIARQRTGPRAAAGFTVVPP